MQGVQQSQLAAAFGLEDAESEGEETPGKAARVQIGNALVSLLESHRKHRQASFSMLRVHCPHLLHHDERAGHPA